MSAPHLDRRLLLQGFGAGVALLGSPRLAWAAVEPLTFTVEIEGLARTSRRVVAVDIDPIRFDIVSDVDADGNPTFGPGDAHYGSITIRARVGKNSTELYSWWLGCSQGKNIRKNISVIATKRDGTEARRWNIIDAFPVRWDPGEYSPSSNVANETIVCKMQRVELALPPPPPPPGPAPRGLSVEGKSPSGFSFFDGDLDATKGGGLVDALRGEGGEDEVCVPVKEVEVTELTLGGPVSDRDWPARLLAEQLKGDKPRNPAWTVVVQGLNRDGEARSTLTYQECFLTSYVFPKFGVVTGNLYEEVNLKPIRLELSA
ncbi:MAG: phage tail protein [Alphaproteobacteria bacterium]|nr:phage tail protein [Alphaproteobacteria bacterium]